MKILIHSNYNPSNFGGIEMVSNFLISALRNDKNNKIDCVYGAKYQSVKYINRVKYYGLKILFKIKGISFLYKGNLNFLKLALKSDLIIFQEPYPSLWVSIFFLNRLLHKKIILLIHADPESLILLKIIYKIIRSIVFKNVTVVATSPQLMEICRSIKSDNRHLIPLGLPDYFSHKISGDIGEDINNIPSRYVLYVGRLAHYKGLKTLVLTIKNTPLVNYVIAGDGPLNRYLVNFIDTNELKNVFFINRFISESEKKMLIKNCLFLVFPSINQNEAFGLVQLEAMIYSKPIINTMIKTGVNYVAPHMVCAITVSPSNSYELTSAINLLSRDSNLRLKLGSLGRKRYQNLFLIDNFFYSWRKLIKDTYN